VLNNNWEQGYSSDIPQGGLELLCILQCTLNQITRKRLKFTLLVKVRKRSSDDENKDTGMNADVHPQASSSDSDCSHQSRTTTITEKLTKVTVDLTSTIENESPMKKTKLFKETIMGRS